MKYAKIVDGIVVQTQPNKQEGFIEVADDVVCTQIKKGNSFVNPPVISKTYAEKRQAAYAPLAEQLDMQYHDTMNGTETWLDHIRSVKEAHPKEGE